MSAVFSRRPQAVTTNVRERAQSAFSPLNLHIAGVAVLGLINLYLLIHMAILWNQATSQNTEALERQKVALKAAQIANQPLQGLDAKLSAASTNADAFYLDRLPATYSQVAAELGTLAKRDSVRLTRVQYSQSAVDGDAAGQLTEVRMDASLGGDYRGLVHFLNSLERDKLFFLVSGITLTGQQTGSVSLRIRITTYLRGLATEEEMQRAAINADASPEGAAETSSEPRSDAGRSGSPGVPLAPAASRASNGRGATR